MESKLIELIVFHLVIIQKYKYNKNMNVQNHVNNYIIIKIIII